VFAAYYTVRLDWFQALDELDVEEFRHGGANITGFRLVNTTSVAARRAAELTSSFQRQPATGSRHAISVSLRVTPRCTLRSLFKVNPFSTWRLHVA